MENFQYLQPTQLKEASKLAGDDFRNILFFAGGTDLLSLMKKGIEAPSQLINLKNIKGLDKIEYKKGKELRIGALVKITDIAAHPVIQKKFTALSDAANEVASPQLRNMGTIGGNLCQRPRCWYFRGDFNCLRKGGDICYAVDGRNKYHCIIGGGPCFIVHPSDTAVALSALNAKLVIQSGRKKKTIPIDSFFVLPDYNVKRENILQPNEIISHIIIPDMAKETVSGFLKFKERAAWDFAIVSVAVVLQRNGDAAKNGKIVFGGVAPKPWVESNASRMLTNAMPKPEVCDQIAENALKNAEPLSENEYKVILARNLLKKILEKLAE